MTPSNAVEFFFISSSGNGLPDVWDQSITWSNNDLLPIETSEADASEIWIKI